MLFKNDVKEMCFTTQYLSTNAYTCKSPGGLTEINFRPKPMFSSILVDVVLRLVARHPVRGSKIHGIREKAGLSKTGMSCRRLGLAALVWFTIRLVLLPVGSLTVTRAIPC
jgi:hypothetical protein